MPVADDAPAAPRPRVRLTERAAQLSDRLNREAGCASRAFATTSADAARSGDLARGTRVGPYRVVRTVGRGGMSVVYEARHVEFGRRVALKVAKFDDPEDPQCRERLLLESLVLEKLHHPTATQLFDVGALADGRAWLAMELLEGESLTERLARGALELREACELLATIADALHAAHAAGVIHRDLKPDNVVVQRRGSPVCKVIDWGIARTRHLPDARITEIGVVSGTPLYMAPEQARGREVDGAADVYALGVIAYEMFCGEPPFDGENSVDILLQHINDAPRLPGSLRSDLPAWLSELILAMLAKEPGQRPGTAAINAALSQGYQPIRELDDVLAELELEPGVASEACTAGSIAGA